MLRNKFKKERKPLVDMNVINVPGQYIRKAKKRSLAENENATASVAGVSLINLHLKCSAHIIPVLSKFCMCLSVLLFWLNKLLQLLLFP